MNALLRFLRTTLIGGALVVLPAWLAVLLVLKVLMKLEVIVKPVSATLPESVGHPQILALLTLLGICFLIGVILKTAIGRHLKHAIEKTVLERVPGYSTLRSLGEQIAGSGGGKGFQPALVEIEDALAPCFIIEHHAGGQCTVFIPSAPTPAAGSILIVATSRVHPLDVPVSTVFQCVSKWGGGSDVLLAAMKPRADARAGA